VYENVFKIKTHRKKTTWKVQLIPIKKCGFLTTKTDKKKTKTKISLSLETGLQVLDEDFQLDLQIYFAIWRKHLLAWWFEDSGLVIVEDFRGLKVLLYNNISSGVIDECYGLCVLTFDLLKLTYVCFDLKEDV